MRLAEKSCVSCHGGVPPLNAEQIAELVPHVPEWRVVGEHHLAREFTFKNFKEALAFVDRVGAIAEEQNHHPDVFLAWGKVKIEIWTHKINGLTESDFIFAAKVDRL